MGQLHSIIGVYEIQFQEIVSSCDCLVRNLDLCRIGLIPKIPDVPRPKFNVDNPEIYISAPTSSACRLYFWIKAVLIWETGQMVPTSETSKVHSILPINQANLIWTNRWLSLPWERNEVNCPKGLLLKNNVTMNTWAVLNGEETS